MNALSISDVFYFVEQQWCLLGHEKNEKKGIWEKNERKDWLKKPQTNNQSNKN